MKRLAIIGSGDLGQQIAQHASTDNQFQVIGFFDDFKPVGAKVGNLVVLGKLSDVVNQFRENKFDEVLIGIGYNHMQFRQDLYKSIAGIVPLARLIHSTCIIDKSCVIGEGTVIYPGAILDQNVLVEENALINLGCCIAHDSIIGAHSFLAPRVSIGGFSKLGAKCILGINCTIIDNLTIYPNTQIGAGGVVVKNIDCAGVYVGNPVKFIRKNNDTI